MKLINEVYENVNAFLFYLSSFLPRVLGKVFLHIVTGRGEIERLVYNKFSKDTVQQVANSIYHSRVLSKTHPRKNTFSLQQNYQYEKISRTNKKTFNVCSTVFASKQFDVRDTALQIISIKHIDTAHPLWAQRAFPNLLKCLKCMNSVNLSLEVLSRIRETKFEIENEEHEAKLEECWGYFFPGVLRRGPLYKSEDWKLLGFQGCDPTTDFRGMGMLGLEQLIFLAGNFPAKANKMLTEAGQNVQTGYPLACVGINISFFVFELLRCRILDRYFYHIIPTTATSEDNRLDRTDYHSNNRLDRKTKDTNRNSLTNSKGERTYSAKTSAKTTQSSSVGGRRASSFSTDARSSALLTFHEIFSVVFIRFHEYYMSCRPRIRDLMDFPPIFNEFKEQTKKSFRQGTFQSDRLKRYIGMV